MMNKANNFVYVLRIFCELINEKDNLIIVAETENLAINIATTKLIENKAFIRVYSKCCGKHAEEFPTLSPLSYDDWLKNAIANNELDGVTITARPLVTYDNVMDIAF